MEASKRLRQRVTTGLSAALIMLCAALPGRAAPLTVMVSPLPVFSEVKNNQTVGYSISLAQGILAQAGLEADVQTVPFARMIDKLQRKELIFASALARLPEREDDYYWITPLSANPISFYVKKSHSLASAAQPGFDDITSASVRRGDYRKGLLQEEGVESLMEVNDWPQAIEAVLKDRVDGVLFSSFGLVMRCYTAGLDCESLVPVIHWGTTYSYMVLPRTPEYAGLAARLSIAATEYKQSPEYEKLVSKTLTELTAIGGEASESEGVISFGGPLQSHTDDLWVMADQVPLFSERNADGKVSGYAAELVRAILTKADVDTSIMSAPWNRIAKESLKPNVMAFSVARTPQRESLYHWITPVSRNMHALYSINKQRYDDFDAVPKSASVAVLRDDYRERVAREAGFRVYNFDSWVAATKALLSGDVDYLFGSRGAVTTACRSLIDSCGEIHLAAEYRTITTYVVLSKENTEPALAERLKAAAVAVKHDPDFQQWSSAWSQQLDSTNRLSHHIEDGVVHLWGKQE